MKVVLSYQLKSMKIEGFCCFGFFSSSFFFVFLVNVSGWALGEVLQFKHVASKSSGFSAAGEFQLSLIVYVLSIRFSTPLL